MSSYDSATIGPGRAVCLHLAIHLEDGSEVLSTFGGEPMRFRIGDGTLAPRLEDLLAGLCAGADEQLLADGATVFGTHDPALIHRLPRSDLPEDFAPEPGDVIQFKTPGGQETPGSVLEVDNSEIEIDFNHPLAHRGLRIRVQVLEVS